MQHEFASRYIVKDSLIIWFLGHTCNDLHVQLTKNKIALIAKSSDYKS